MNTFSGRLGIPIALLLLAAAMPALAVQFTVDSPVDAADQTPGDRRCETAAGACTLRAAIQEANAWNGPDTITVPAGRYVLTIVAA